MRKIKQEGKGTLTIANVNGDTESAALTPKEELAALIERYKLQNPVKYEVKKEALEKQLNSLN